MHLTSGLTSAKKSTLQQPPTHSPVLFSLDLLVLPPGTYWLHWLPKLWKIPSNRGEATTGRAKPWKTGNQVPLWPLTGSVILVASLTHSEPCFPIFFFFLNLFIYLFLAVLGLRFCARAFSSCGKRWPLFIAVRGPLTVAASPVAEHRLQTRRLSSCGARV